MSRVIVFDVNETLLDLAALDSPFQRIFGQAGVRREWFGQFLQSALVATITNTYSPFGDIAMSALEMVANRHGHTLNDEDRNVIKQTMSALPAHPEVAQSLELLQSAGLRLATLTNSTE
ncbi:MAG: haloacid dehalogenase type II, partial [Chloroflexota bacterium]|nr:haloacid dehalogenase type II [Chloroflexota bacterium]